MYYKYIHTHACCPLPIAQSTRLVLGVFTAYMGSICQITDMCRQNIGETILSVSTPASKLAVLFKDAVEEVLHYVEFRQFRM
jgi:hypothetical protein